METVRFIFGISIQRPSRIAKFSLATTASVALPAPARVAAGRSCKIRPQTTARFKSDSPALGVRDLHSFASGRGWRVAGKARVPSLYHRSSKSQLPNPRQNLNFKLQKMSASKDIFAIFSFGIWDFGSTSRTVSDAKHQAN